MSLDPFIKVDVSKLETQSEKTRILKLFEDSGWKYHHYDYIGFKRFTGELIISVYWFHWEGIGELIYPTIPPSCKVTRIH